MSVEDSVRGTVLMSRATLSSVVTINPDVTFRELDGEIVILNLETGIYFGLDAVGARTWRLIEDHGSLGVVFEALRSEYDAVPSVLERDLSSSSTTCARKD